MQSRQEAFRINFDWQEQWFGAIETETIVKRHAALFVDLRLATKLEDTKQSTDAVIEISGGGTLAIRVRRTYCAWRDLTIRYKLPTGNETEIDKLRAGWGDYYVYAWCDRTGRINDYMLINLHKLRSSGLLNMDWHVSKNKTKNPTQFISIHPHYLLQAGAVEAFKIDNPQKYLLEQGNTAIHHWQNLSPDVMNYSYRLTLLRSGLSKGA